MSSTVQLTINNNSGKDLVIAFLQGGLPGQTADQLKWLLFTDAITLPIVTEWQVPSTPKSNADLAPFMLDVSSGTSVTVGVPSYSELVGFRCLVSETAYKTDAMQVLGTTNYMAFPNLTTAPYAFDKFEAGLTEGTPGIWNITSVDFLSIPMQLTKGAETVGYKVGVTAAGMNALLAQLEAPYGTGGSIAPNTPEKTVRFFSPQHIAGATTCLDSAITTGLPQLEGSISTVKYGTDEFSNFRNATSGGSPVVGAITCTSALAGEITVSDISTAKAFAGTIGLNGPNNSTVVFGALVAAAMCRGVLGHPEKWGDINYPNTQCSTPWNYYPAGTESDAYSKMIHAYSIGGKNYGFSYDDYFGDEAGYNVLPGESVSLNILAIDGPMTATANPAPPVKTGCLSVGTPDPVGQAARMGSMSCNGIDINAESSGLCFLENTVVITFANAPAPYVNPEIHIDLTNTNSAEALTYWNNGAQSTTISVIGLVYSAAQRQLSFGATSAWQG